MKHPLFIARTVLVRDGRVDEAMRTLNRILGYEGVFDHYRRTRFYEKPCQVRRRVNYETCKAIYDEDMSNKIAFTMKKNRVDPWPGR